MGLRHKRDNILTEKEISNMVESAKGVRDKALIMFLYLTGCRVTEALNIKASDFFFEEEPDLVHINIITLKTRKKSRLPTRRTLYVRGDHPAIKYILDYILLLEPEQRLFPISRIQVWRIIKKLNDKAWVHLFRDTRSTMLAQDGWSTDRLMEYFGWSKRETADNYIQKEARELKSMADKIR